MRCFVSKTIYPLLALLLCLASQGKAEDTHKIVMLGDSITHGVRTGVTAEQTFASLVHKQLNAEGIPATVVNVGIGGERTDQALKRLERDVLTKQPQVTVIMYGTNDSYVDQGKSQSRISAVEFEQNLRALVQQLRKEKIRVILMTEPRWGEAAGNNGAGEHPNLRLEEYMERCRLVSKDLQVPLVDNYAIWTKRQQAGQTLGDWTTDQCHPNPTGHRVIAESLLPVLKKLKSISFAK